MLLNIFCCSKIWFFVVLDDFLNEKREISFLITDRSAEFLHLFRFDVEN